MLPGSLGSLAVCCKKEIPGITFEALKLACDCFAIKKADGFEGAR
jgi:hypothetical protein